MELALLADETFFQCEKKKKGLKRSDEMANLKSPCLIPNDEMKAVMGSEYTLG